MNEKKANQLSIFSANCLNLRSPLSDCHICENVCPQHTLLFRNGTWHASNCTLCGACAMVCPTQVFQIDLPQLLHLEAQHLLLTCTQHPAVPEHALRINCIQQLNPLAILHLLYHHPSITLYLPLAQCTQCTQQWYPEGLLQQLRQYQIPTDKLQIITTTAQESSEPENERRELLRDLFHRTETATKKMLVQTVEKISAEFSSQEITQQEPAVFPNRLPLYALYVKKQLPVPNEQTLPFRQLQCTRCSFCTACAHVCPTQAITIETPQAQTQEQTMHLLFHPELCINCNLCEKICMQHGLTWGDFMETKQFLASPMLLAHSTEQTCSQCGHTFYQWPPNEADTIPICTFCQ